MKVRIVASDFPGSTYEEIDITVEQETVNIGDDPGVILKNLLTQGTNKVRAAYNG